MRRLNPAQAGSYGVMPTSASPLRRCGVLGRTAALGSFADSCGNTTPKEWQRRRLDDSTRERRVLRRLPCFFYCWPTAHDPTAVLPCHPSAAAAHAVDIAPLELLD